jgi:hypothetical protein
MRVWCQTAHRRFWRVEERFVDALGMIEYWVCAMCHRRWTIALPPAPSPTGLVRGPAEPAGATRESLTSHPSRPSTS